MTNTTTVRLDDDVKRSLDHVRRELAFILAKPVTISETVKYLITVRETQRRTPKP